MKKTFALVLTIVLIFSLSVPAFASSVVAPKETKEETADMPTVVGGDVRLVPAEELSVEQEVEVEEAVAAIESIFTGSPEAVMEVFGGDIEAVKEIFGEDIETVEDIDFEAITVNYVNYVEASDDGTSTVVVDLEGDFTEVIAMILVDGKLIKVNVMKNADGTYTLDIPCSGVLTIMTR